MDARLIMRLAKPFAARAFGLLVVAATAAVVPAAPAAAEGVFDFLFGGLRRLGPPGSASPFADPRASERNGDSERRSAGTGGRGVFCVRLCDGRYFPLQRMSSANAAQVCNSFCPASQTKVFSGSAIDHAVASDGIRYASLRNAFVYREHTVENCTCNGRDAYGLVTPSVTEDPTLRPGDIVATNDGFVAYTGAGNRRAAEFTPLQSYPGLPPELRQRLTQTRIAPTNATPVSPEALHESTGSIRDGRNRQVQLDR
jgi:hypothetical protein